jgi:hypothetical protein
MAAKETTVRANELIAKSGNTFHYQVVNFLRERDWSVLVSPYYSDYISDKSKEIDIVAERQFEFPKRGSAKKVQIDVKLFIECKYINSEIVLWFDDKDKMRARTKIVRDTPLKEDNSYTEKHHYLTDSKVAKLFTPNANKDDVFYKALNQVLSAMIFHSGEGLGSIFPSISPTLNYPLILCNTFRHLYRVDAEQTTYSKVDQDFQLEVNYAYLTKNRESRSQYFLIDVINFNMFDNFLNGPMRTDVETVAYVLQ